MIFSYPIVLACGKQYLLLRTLDPQNLPLQMEGLKVWKLPHQEPLTEWMENQKLQLYQVLAQYLQ